MKYILAITLLFTFYTHTNAQDLESLGALKDRAGFQLKANPVTLVTRTLRPPKDTTIVFAAEPLATGPSWPMIKEEQLLFDTASGLLLQNITKEIQRKKEEQNTTRYWYRKPGNRLMAISTYDNSRLADSSNLRYNKAGQLLQYIATNGKGQPAFRVTYTYDHKKQLTIIRKLNEDDFPVEMIKYKYAANGLLMETQHFDKNFRQVATKKYSIKREKDSTTNLSAATYNDLSALMSGYTQAKDRKGRVTEESQVDKDRHIVEYRGYEYNEKDDVVAEKVISATLEEHRTYRYRYDDRNNWISRETYKNEELQTVEERTLTY